MPDVPDDLQGCERCGKEYEIEQMTMMVDCWFCKACTDEWQKHFDACEHRWEPECVDGDEGKFCTKCTGFVRDEDFAALIESPASVAHGTASIPSQAVQPISPHPHSSTEEV